jgi:hypothetical protein
MMVNLSKPEIFKWQMAQSIDRIVRSNFAFADFLKKLADGFGVQEGTQQSALGMQPS